MSNTKIKKIIAREILDSRGNPTVETLVVLQDGSEGVAAVPSGASTGTHEALELRDNAKRYGGKGVQKAVNNVNLKIAKALLGLDVLKQRKIDQTMLNLDGTELKSKLGANAILSVSMACARAGAVSLKKPLYKYLRQAYKLPENKWRLPIPTMNILNGGRHADNGIAVQEFMVIPINKKMSERIRIGAEVFHSLAKILKEKGKKINVGDEGGFAPELDSIEDALKNIMQAIHAAGYTPGKEVYLGLDCAASEYYKNGGYFLKKNESLKGELVLSVLNEWIKRYPILSIEDAFAEDDWEHWQLFTKKLGNKVTIVGDDLFVTNVKRIQKGIDSGAANAVLIKLNQIGTLSETIDAIYLAKQNEYKVSVSHRSGETADTFIADLAVAVNAEFIKTGSLSRSERVEKYNRLMKIESELNS